MEKISQDEREKIREENNQCHKVGIMSNNFAPLPSHYQYDNIKSNSAKMSIGIRKFADMFYNSNKIAFKGH